MDFGNKLMIGIIGFCLMIVGYSATQAIGNHIPVNDSIGHQVYSNGECVENNYKISTHDIEKYGDMETAIKAKNIKPSYTSICKTMIAR